MRRFLDLPTQHRSAQLRSSSFDAVANTVAVVWTTGAAVVRNDWLDGAYSEVLLCGPENVRLGRLNAGASFLNSHNSFDLASVIGSVVPGSAHMSAGAGMATVQLSRAAADADIVSKIADGVIRNISVGYVVHAFTRSEAVDGSMPVLTATDWEPVEISAVAVPADAGAQIRSRNTPQLHRCTIMTEREAGAAMAGRVLGKTLADRSTIRAEVEAELAEFDRQREAEADFARGRAMATRNLATQKQAKALHDEGMRRLRS